MRSFLDFPIKHKLIGIIMLTSVMAVLLACLVFIAYEQVMFRRTLVRDFSILAEVIQENIAPGLTFNDAREMEKTLRSMQAQPHILAGAVYDLAGKRVATYERSKQPGGFPWPTKVDDVSHFHSDRLDTFQRIQLAGEVIGMLYIASDLGELKERQARYTLTGGLVLLLTGVVAYLLATRLQRFISVPLVGLAQTASRVTTEKNFALRAVKHGQDELGSLIDQFNEMLAQIERQEGSLREANEQLEQRVEIRTRELKQEATEHQRAREGLTEAQQRLKLATESAHLGIWVWDLKTNSLVWDAQMYQLYGIPTQDFSGAYDAWQNGLHPEDRHRVEAEIAVAAQGDKGFHIEFRIRWPNGEVRHIEAHGLVQRAEDGSPAHMIGVNWDITKRKQAEQELRSSEELLRRVMDSSQDCIKVLNLDGELLWMNEGGQRIMEIDDFEVVKNKGWTDLWPAEGSASAANALALAKANGVGKFIGFCPTAKGAARWWEVVVTPVLNDAGAPDKILSVSRDITKRKEAELELREAQQNLIQISRQAGMAEVATSVLHNVGNVLNSVSVSAEVVAGKLRQSKAGGLKAVAALLREHAHDLPAFLAHDPRGKEMPDYLLKLIEHLAQPQPGILQELDALRRNIEHIKEIVATQQRHARGSEVLETLSVTELVEEALSINAAGFGRHEVELIKELPPLPPLVTDRHKVLQILVNLVNNAKHALAKVAGEKRLIVRATLHETEGVRIAVIDNGVGIAPENLGRIFQHGFTTKKDGHGFGLHSGALAAKELGGRLTVHSDGLGHGAVFTLELPLQKQKA